MNNQIGIRPELSFGKFGMMLDLSLYIDGEGNIASQYWDSPQDILEKIYYLRWGRKGDPFYIKVGAIDNYRLGFGILMNRYANTIQYPSVIRVGGTMGFKAGNFGMDVFVNNITPCWKDFTKAFLKLFLHLLPAMKVLHRLCQHRLFQNRRM